MIKEIIKSAIKDTPLDSVVRKTYARFIGNEVLLALYYRDMNKVIQKLDPESFCVDIGCYKGAVLDMMLERVEAKNVLAIEPLPQRFNELSNRYPQIDFHKVALSDEPGETTFSFVKGCDSHSGLLERDYPKDVEIEKIPVNLVALDSLLSDKERVDFIKLDVEGAELQVFRGAKQTLLNKKPLVVFQHGKGSAEYYNTGPADIYAILAKEYGYQISTLENFLKSRTSFSEEEFIAQFENRKNYFFIAHPTQNS